MGSSRTRGPAIKALPTKANPVGADLIFGEDSQNKFKKIAIPISAFATGSQILGQVSSLTELSTYSADQGYLMMVTSESTIYEYSEDIGNRTCNGTTIVPAGIPGVSGWVGISGKNSYYTSLARVDVGAVDFSGGNTQFPLTLTALVTHSRRSTRLLADDYITSVSSILFWDIISIHYGTQEVKRILGQRYATTQLLLDAVSSLITDRGDGLLAEDIMISCYLKQDTGGENSLNRVNAYNLMFTQIKGKYAGSGNRKIATLQNIEDAGNTFTQRDAFVNMIYNDFLGVATAVSIPNILSTISCTTSLRSKLYSLHPTKTSVGYKSSLFIQQNNATGKRIFDATTQTVSAPISSSENIPMYILNSRVYGRGIYQNFNDPMGSFGEEPSVSMYNESSSVRVYHYVNDINVPTLHFFMIKPIGQDTFITPYTAMGRNNARCGIFVSDTFGVKRVATFTPEHINSPDKNRGFRILRSTYVSLVHSSFTRTAASKPSSRFFKFFHYDEVTGVISGFTPTVYVHTKTAGATVKMLMHRGR